MAFLIIVLTVAALGLAATNWAALSIPLVAAVLALIAHQRRGNDGIDSFFGLLMGITVIAWIADGAISIGKRLVGFIGGLL